MSTDKLTEVVVVKENPFRIEVKPFEYNGKKTVNCKFIKIQDEEKWVHESDIIPLSFDFALHDREHIIYQGPGIDINEIKTNGYYFNNTKYKEKMLGITVGDLLFFMPKSILHMVYREIKI